MIDGENDGINQNSLRDARKFLISDQKFQTFIQTHKSIKALVAEDNSTMRVWYTFIFRGFDLIVNKSYFV